MIPQLFVENIDLGDGRNITIETGRLQTSWWFLVVRIGKTVILGTVVSARKASPGITFYLNDYREKLQQQVSCFPGGFSKREARPSDNEVQQCAVLRPLFHLIIMQKHKLWDS
jgi:polyribonucleotide nucleotidyltransferase